jgi:tRNA nucleotidyltransferase/poly(A) polymerase
MNIYQSVKSRTFKCTRFLNRLHRTDRFKFVHGAGKRFTETFTFQRPQVPRTIDSSILMTEVGVDLLITKGTGNLSGSNTLHSIPPPSISPTTISRGRTSIFLSNQEKQLFDILINTVKFASLNTVVRVAGGWVRDKLLHLHSHDIDIALNDMTGHEFAQHVNAYLASKGSKVSTIGVIQVNPSQSKHLETATVKIYLTPSEDGSSESESVWVDFVNLRTESYENTRIPVIRFGTPMEDSFRRDFTINSMFYNISENVIEDFTGFGLEDLQHRILRTPMDPSVTFVDDPLRILRAIRFSCRFQCKLTPNLQKAIISPSINHGLITKVSRERIGNEVDLMLLHQKPITAMRALFSYNLSSILFPCPTARDSFPIVSTSSERSGRAILIPWKLVSPSHSVPGQGKHIFLEPSACLAQSEYETLASFEALYFDSSVQHFLPADETEMEVEDQETEQRNKLREMFKSSQFPASWLKVSAMCVNTLDYVFSILPKFDHSILLRIEETLGAVAPPKATGLNPFSSSDSNIQNVEAFNESLFANFPAQTCFSNDDIRLLIYSCILFPIHHFQFLMLKKNQKIVDEKIVNYYLFESLRRKSKDVEEVFNICQGALEMVALMNSLNHELANTNSDKIRITLGEIIRNKSKDKWFLSLYLSVVIELTSRMYPVSVHEHGQRQVSVDEVKWVLTKYVELHAFIETWNLNRAYLLKPMLDGKEVMAMFQIRGGPIVRTLQESQIKWQLQFPHLDKEACVKMLEEEVRKEKEKEINI